MDIYKPRRYTEYGDSVTIKWGRDSTVRVEDPEAIDGRGIADLLIRLSPLTNFKGNETFEVVRRESYKRDGVKRHRIEFRQTIHGMPLDQTGKIVVSDDEYVRSISVMAVDDTWLDSDSAALITEEEALQIAINDLKKYGLSEIEQSPSTYFAGYVVASHRKLSPVLIAGFSAKRQGGGTVGYTARVNLNNGEVRSWPSQDEFWPIYIDLTTRFSLAFNAALSEPIVSTSCD